MCEEGTAEVVEQADAEVGAPLSGYITRGQDSENRILVPEDGSMTSCINICRLTRLDGPPCIAFVLTAPMSTLAAAAQVACFPLYADDGDRGAIQREFVVEEGDRVFNIEGCLPGAVSALFSRWDCSDIEKIVLTNREYYYLRVPTHRDV